VTPRESNGDGDCLKSERGDSSLLPYRISNALPQTEILKLESLASIRRNGNGFEGFVVDNRNLFTRSIEGALGAFGSARATLAGWPAVIPGVGSALTGGGLPIILFVGTTLGGAERSALSFLSGTPISGFVASTLAPRGLAVSVGLRPTLLLVLK